MRRGTVAVSVLLLALPAGGVHAGAERSLDGVVVQMEYVPTWAYPEDMQTFGRVPELTMFEDGTVIYLEETAPPEVGYFVRSTKLGPGERSTLVEALLERGFMRLQSHPSNRWENADGTAVVRYDAAISVISVRLPNGDLRTIRNYGGFANDRRALDSVREYLSTWSSADAQPYAPERATLFFKRLPLQSGGSHGHLPVVSWSLPDALLQPPESDVCEWAIAIGGREYRSLVPSQGTVPQSTAVRIQHQDEHFYVSVVPWLPNEDHSEAVRHYRHRCR